MNYILKNSFIEREKDMMAIEIEDVKEQIFKHLKVLYGENIAEKYFPKLIKLLDNFKKKYGKKSGRYFPDEKEIILITYGDQVQNKPDNHLKTFHYFMNKYLKDVISTIHFLPIFPYSSDDGFSVIDYKKVNPELGDWEDILNIKNDYKLMLDLVLNHISRESEWFKKFLDEDEEYIDFFIVVDKDADLCEVVRPRTTPLKTEVKTKSGIKYVWTTFSSDQIDLNYKNPEVLLRIIDILLYYIEKGAKYIRLDAIAYVWKEIGTCCIHLIQTHTLVKLFRAILDYCAPDVNIITETNVPHEENVSYFGNGYDEAQLIYQFALPPLILFSFIKENTNYLTNWAKSLTLPSKYVTFFNFTASHDGIGLRPVEHILSKDEINELVEYTIKCGGYVSYKENSDGSKSPYELNITYFSAIIGPNIKNMDKNLQASKFIASQAIQLSLAGVPGIYFHSIFGTKNYQEGVKKTGMYRSINRRKCQLKELEHLLNDKNSIAHKVYTSYINLLKIRKGQKAFHPNADQIILDLDDRLFSLIRISTDHEQAILILINVSNSSFKLSLNLDDLKIHQFNNVDKLLELITREEFEIKNNVLEINIKPYQVVWLSNKCY